MIRGIERTAAKGAVQIGVAGLVLAVVLVFLLGAKQVFVTEGIGIFALFGALGGLVIAYWLGRRSADGIATGSWFKAIAFGCGVALGTLECMILLGALAYTVFWAFAGVHSRLEWVNVLAPLAIVNYVGALPALVLGSIYAATVKQSAKA